ncbi:MAG TPA: helix-turn-helix transcriptional regulator [Kofleriaceae bacterium]|jgi:transcriptional regulator with XRE-family HTH domain
MQSRVNEVDTSARRREAGEFLRSRRERLSPSTVGLPAGVRRRTPGLRREEVAMLADVGTTWYTWLEQGRDVRPSVDALEALATALRLDAAERRHLFELHDRASPERVASVEAIDGPTRRMLDNLTLQPAFVLGKRWDIIAWNRAADLVYGPYDRLVGDERNTLHLLFTDAAHRRLLVDWEAVARNSLAMFRADCARNVGNPDFERLVVRLMRRSPEFAAWWPQREVARPLAGTKRIDHPTAGRMVFEYASLGVGDPPEMKLIMFTPTDHDDTAEKLRRLLA